MLYETCPSVQGGAGNNEAHLFNVATLAALGYVEAGFAEVWKVQVVKGKRKAGPSRSKQGWEEKALAYRRTGSRLPVGRKSHSLPFCP